MKTIELQNWIITDIGIRYVGPVAINYTIRKDMLLGVGRGDRQNTIDILISMAEKSWITFEDLMALNRVFILAIERYGMTLPINVSIKKTVQLQLSEFNSRKK